jgi:hypothetical protein
VGGAEPVSRQTPSFGIRVGKTRRTWIVIKEPNRTKVSLGHYPALSLSEARKKALIALGSPLVRSSAPTFTEALEEFLSLDRCKPYSKYQLTRNIKNYFSTGKTLDINVRVPTKAYRKLRKRADREGRTLVGLIEVPG